MLNFQKLQYEIIGLVVKFFKPPHSCKADKGSCQLSFEES